MSHAPMRHRPNNGQRDNQHCTHNLKQNSKLKFNDIFWQLHRNLRKFYCSLGGHKSGSGCNSNMNNLVSYPHILTHLAIIRGRTDLFIVI
jgi:hypothetical protein